MSRLLETDANRRLTALAAAALLVPLAVECVTAFRIRLLLPAHSAPHSELPGSAQPRARQ